MRVMFAVLDDLFQFALRSIFGALVTNKVELTEPEPVPLLQPHLPLLLPSQKIIQTFPVARDNWYICHPNAPIRTDPVVAFDNVITRLPYGQAVKLMTRGARWIMVRADDISGWVDSQQVADVVTDVFPVFAAGSVYDAAAPATVALRRLINDAFNCVELALPLSGLEYVAYRLALAGRWIDWPATRPRTAGQWQRILRGRPGVHLGIVPKTGSVMECLIGEDNFLLYVDAVFPDESIQVTAVGYDGLGVYTENVFQKEVWRELRPVFIEVI